MSYHKPEQAPKIIEWTDTAPRNSRESVWDEVVQEVRSKGSDQWAKVDRMGLTPNSQWFTKAYPDIEYRAPKKSQYAWLRVKPEPKYDTPVERDDIPPGAPVEMAEMGPPPS